MTADANTSALSELARWLSDARDRIDRQVHVRKRAARKETAVKIDHRLSCDLESHTGWYVHTRPTFLPRAHFSSQVRFTIKTAAGMRGRAIFCHDLNEQEVVAVISYHVDEGVHMPVLITTLGFRTDTAGNAFLSYRTLAGALVLKHYLHTIANKIGRGGHLDLDLADKAQLEVARELGFRRAPKVKGFRPGGLHLRQQAPGQDVGRG